VTTLDYCALYKHSYLLRAYILLKHCKQLCKIRSNYWAVISIAFERYIVDVLSLT